MERALMGDSEVVLKRDGEIEMGLEGVETRMRG
jgi:hypothetical protein